MIFVISVLLKNAFNSPPRLSVSQSVLACWISVVSAACFYAGWCSDLAWRYMSVCVDFLYIECPSDPRKLYHTLHRSH